MFQLALFTSFTEIWEDDAGEKTLVSGYRYWNGYIEILSSVLL